MAQSEVPPHNAVLFFFIPNCRCDLTRLNPPGGLPDQQKFRPATGGGFVNIIIALLGQIHKPLQIGRVRRYGQNTLPKLIIKFFGEGYIGGKLAINFISFVLPEDEVTARGVVKDKIVEGDKVRLILDVWCENQRGEKVLVGTASGLAR